MRKRAKHLAIMAVILAVPFGIAWALTRRAGPRSPLEAMPAETRFVARAAVPALLRSQVVRAFFPDVERASARLRDDCGIDAARAVPELWLFGGERGLTAVLARIEGDPAALDACVGRALDAEGLSAERRTIDGHEVLSAGNARVFMVTPDLFFGGDEASASAVLDVAAGRHASLAGQSLATRLSRESSHDLAMAGSLSASARRQIATMAGDDVASALESARFYTIAIDSVDDGMVLAASIDASDAQGVAAALESAVARMSATTALGRLVSRLEIRSTGDVVRARATLGGQDLMAIAMALGEVSPAREPAEASIAPDEVLRR